jgi:hypothetical protein
MTACTYCGSEVEVHDPVVVTEGMGDHAEPAGHFCNYACLLQHIQEADLTLGAACRIDCC